jgi:hypothetical protein
VQCTENPSANIHRSLLGNVGRVAFTRNFGESAKDHNYFIMIRCASTHHHLALCQFRSKSVKKCRRSSVREGCWWNTLSAKGHNHFKIRRTGKSWSHAHLPIIILLCANFGQNPLRNVGGVHEGFWWNTLSAKGHNSFKNRRTGKSRSHAHLPIVILLCANLGQNP